MGKAAVVVKRTLEGLVTEECPATILCRHDSARPYLDAGSSGSLIL